MYFRTANRACPKMLELCLHQERERASARVGDAGLPGAAGAGVPIIADRERWIGVEDVLDAEGYVIAVQANIAHRRIVDDVVVDVLVVVRPTDRASGDARQSEILVTEAEDLRQGDAEVVIGIAHEGVVFP